jgi:hypothetical protein
MTRHRNQPDEPVTIRTAGRDDLDALRRLAELDCARPLTGHLLLAEHHGAPGRRDFAGSGIGRSRPVPAERGRRPPAEAAALSAAPPRRRHRTGALAAPAPPAGRSEVRPRKSGIRFGELTEAAAARAYGRPMSTAAATKPKSRSPWMAAAGSARVGSPATAVGSAAALCSTRSLSCSFPSSPSRRRGRRCSHQPTW